MKATMKRIAVAATLALLLTGCAKEVPSGPRNLLPGLEARTKYGFSIDEASKALESLRTVVDNALTAGVAFSELDFDILNELSPEIAILPGDMNITSLGGAATIVAVENEGKYLMGAAYGDSGFCLYMKITEGTPLKIERGIGFAIDCNADKASDSITWSSDESFPGTDKVELPEGNLSVGVPQNGEVPSGEVPNNGGANGTQNPAPSVGNQPTSAPTAPSSPNTSGTPAR
jgi:hypothetical protein